MANAHAKPMHIFRLQRSQLALSCIASESKGFLSLKMPLPKRQIDSYLNI